MKTPRRIDAGDQPLRKFRNELDGMFQRFFDEPFLSNIPFGSGNDITPACNIAEKSDRYTIEVEVPGVDPSNVDIEIDNHTLKITGERKQEFEEEDKETQMHTIEHSYGSFYRAFSLPDGIDDDQITAHDKNGILYIEIPKSTESKSRRIQINKKD